MDYEKLGLFYLGKQYDPGTRARTEVPVLYESADLVTHAVIVGMTGSGKTGLGIGLIEEAAIDGIPVLISRSEGRPGQSAAHVPKPVGRGLHAVGEPGRSTRGRADSGGVWRQRGRAVGRRTCRLGPERRTGGRFRAGRRLHGLHAGQHARAANLHRGLLCGSRAGGDRRPRPAGRSGGCGRHQRARPRRHRCRAAAKPRAHPAVHAVRGAVAGGPGSRFGVAHHARPDAAGRPRSA